MYCKQSCPFAQCYVALKSCNNVCLMSICVKNTLFELLNSLIYTIDCFHIYNGLIATGIYEKTYRRGIDKTRSYYKVRLSLLMLCWWRRWWICVLSSGVVVLVSWLLTFAGSVALLIAVVARDVVAAAWTVIVGVAVVVWPFSLVIIA
jgi:hypothetical protein